MTDCRIRRWGLGILLCGILPLGLLAADSRAAVQPTAVAAPAATADPFARLRRPVSAADADYWQQVSDSLSRLETLEGAAYSVRHGVLTLHGKPASGRGPYHLDDLMVALKAALCEKQDVGMTIDPDPQNPMGEKMIVRYFGGCDNTAFGWVLFECDRMLKSLSHGEDSLTKVALKPKVAEFLTMLELGQALGVPQSEWNRFWLTTDVEEGPTWRDRPRQSNRYQPVLSETADEKAVRFQHCRLYLRTEVMQLQGGQMVSVKGRSSKAADRFAVHFSNRFDEFAGQFPEFARAAALARLVVLAEWIAKANIPMDVDYIRNYRQQVPVRTPTLTPASRVAREAVQQAGDQIVKHVVSSYGGVDFKPRTFFASDPKGEAAHYQQAGEKGLASHPRESSFRTESGGQSSQTVVIPTQNTRFQSEKKTPTRCAQMAPPRGKDPPPTDALPPAPAVAGADTAEPVLYAPISLANIEESRANQARGPPEGDRLGLADGRYRAGVDVSEAVLARGAALLAGIDASTVNMIRGPPKTPATTSRPGVDTSERPLVRLPPLAPLDVERPRPTPRAGADQLTTPQQKTAVPSPPSATAGRTTQATADRSEKVLSGAVPLTKPRVSDPRSTTSPRSEARVEPATLVTASTTTEDAGDKPWGFPVFQTSSTTSVTPTATYGLPRLVMHASPRHTRKAGIQGRPDTAIQVLDQLSLTSETGDILVTFGEPEIDQRRAVMYYPPAPAGAYGLVGYYPQTKSLEFRDGMRVEFNEHGHPRSAKMADGTLFEFGYSKSAAVGRWPQPVACRVTAANDRAQSGVYWLTSTEQPTTAGSAPASAPPTETKPTQPKPTEAKPTEVKPSASQPAVTPAASPASPLPKDQPAPPAASSSPPAPDTAPAGVAAPAPTASSAAPRDDSPVAAAGGRTPPAAATPAPVPLEFDAAIDAATRIGVDLRLAPGQSLTIERPLLFGSRTASGTWQARLRGRETPPEARNAPGWTGDQVRLRGADGKVCQVSLQPSSGEFHPGERAAASLVLTRLPDAEADASPALDSYVDFFVDFDVQWPSDGGPQRGVTAIPIRLEPSPGGSAGLVVLGVAALITLAAVGVALLRRA
jgi:hypothetical protein